MSGCPARGWRGSTPGARSWWPTASWPAPPRWLRGAARGRGGGPGGSAEREGGAPRAPDTIFRIASMSKPITSVAVMMLYEEGKLLLNDPVSKYIPAFRTMRVANADGTTVPATRQITIRDLLSHRSGISYGFLNGGPVGAAYRAN